MYWLPVAGMIMRPACGITTCGSASLRHAKRASRVALALVDGEDAAPDDLAHVRAFGQAQSRKGRTEGRDSGVIGTLTRSMP